VKEVEVVDVEVVLGDEDVKLAAAVAESSSKIDHEMEESNLSPNGEIEPSVESPVEEASEQKGNKLERQTKSKDAVDEDKTANAANTRRSPRRRIRAVAEVETLKRTARATRQAKNFESSKEANAQKETRLLRKPADKDPDLNAPVLQQRIKSQNL
jgi:predicted ATPase